MSSAIPVLQVGEEYCKPLKSEILPEKADGFCFVCSSTGFLHCITLQIRDRHAADRIIRMVGGMLVFNAMFPGHLFRICSCEKHNTELLRLQAILYDGIISRTKVELALNT